MENLNNNFTEVNEIKLEEISISSLLPILEGEKNDEELSSVDSVEVETIQEANFSISEQADIDISTISTTSFSEEDEEDNFEKEIELTFDSYDKLPILFQEICSCFDEKDRLMMLLSSITVVSSILPKVYGEYDRKKIYSNLFLYVTGKAGSGKGNMNWSKKLTSVIESNIKITEENSKLVASILLQGGKIESVFPTEKISIPGNSSTAGITQLLEKQNGNGLIFETEGDTIGNVFKREYGDYSDLLRKAFHHETISQYRKTNEEYTYINEPKVSVLISSTPSQLKSIIPSLENGLFSRFIFFNTIPNNEFLDVFNKGENNRDEIFDKNAEELQVLFLKLKESEGVKISLSVHQQKLFIEKCNLNKSILINLVNDDLDATANRMGLIMFRIMMVLTAIRYKNEELSKELFCHEDDFILTLELADILINNAVETIKMLPKSGGIISNDPKSKVFQMLPNEFTTKDAKILAVQYGVAERSIDRFLKSALFEKVGHGLWKKSTSK
jgi:hypothetical protein